MDVAKLLRMVYTFQMLLLRFVRQKQSSVKTLLLFLYTEILKKELGYNGR